MKATQLSNIEFYDPEPYREEWLPEDAAYLRLSRYPWPVTPELLFSMKQHIVGEASKRGLIYDRTEAEGLDIGY